MIPIPASGVKQPARPATPWADPVEADEAEPVMEAEVVYPGAPPAAPLEADELFGPSGAYGDPMATGPLIQPLPPRSAPPPSPTRESRRERRGDRHPRPLGIFLLALLHFLVGAMIMATGVSLGGVRGLPGLSPAVCLIGCTFIASLFVGAGVGMFQGVKWIWWLEAFGFAWSICTSVLGIVVSLFFWNQMGARGAVNLLFKYPIRLVVGALILTYLLSENVRAFFRLKRLDTGQALGILFGLAITLILLLNGIVYLIVRAHSAPESSPQAAPAPINPAPVNNEPPASGSGITIWDAKQRAGGAFSVECRVDDGTLDPSRAYFWVINGPTGKVEFPIPGTAWAKQRQQLSGRAQTADSAEVAGPLSCYLEEQVGGTRQRISNEVPVGR
ncbi:MAG TPA: hypothetical protein PK867_31105 [Pirellulales bacterium]|nr:hypothetical protein [Pirellulales bacterium]